MSMSSSAKWIFLIDSLNRYGHAAQPRGRVSSPGRVKNCKFSVSFRPIPKCTEAPIQWVPGRGGSSPRRGVKRAGSEADHSPKTNAEVNNMWIFTSIFPYVFIAQWPPLWSSGQSSWLQIRRPGFDSRHYQKKGNGSGTGSAQPREYNWGATW
jgi:hypothetical protein